MNATQLFLMLRARLWLVVLVLLAAVGGTYAVMQYLPKEYTASTTLYVDVQSRDPVSALFAPASMATQQDLIRSARVMRMVVKNLALEEHPLVRQLWLEATGGRKRLESWLTSLLHKKLTVIPPRHDSRILTIAFTGPDPQFAATVANAFAQAYVEANLELRTAPARQYAQWFDEQGKVLRADLERAQARLSEFQQKRGIVTREENLDAETAKLAELTSQLTSLQAQTADARSRQRSGAETLPEVMSNPVVVGLRADIARLEAKIKDALTNLGRNHPQMRSMEAELAELRARLALESRHVASSFGATGDVGAARERALQAAIEAQRKKLLQLRVDRDQLAVLQRDVDAARSTYDSVASRFTQATLESQANTTNVSILSRASTPPEPSHPDELRYLVISLLLGLFAGLGLAFLWELLDRRVRCVDDLAEMMQMPVLGVVERDRKRQKRLRLQARLAALPLK